MKTNAELFLLVTSEIGGICRIGLSAHRRIILPTVAKLGYGRGRYLEAVIRSSAPNEILYYAMRGNVLRTRVDNTLETEKVCIIRQIPNPNVVLFLACILHRFPKDFPNVGNILVQGQRRREFRVFNDFLPILFLVLFQKLRRPMQMRYLKW